MTTKILVLGSGYLGKEFERHGIETWNKDQFKVNYPECTFSGYGLDELKRYNVVVNCIGKSNTRWCEDRDNFKEALFVNGKLPRVLSSFCNKNNIKFVHISTGCLYDDTTISNTEDSPISAHCNYTVSKWVGEYTCNANTDLIIRPRLLFSDVMDKNNLLCKLCKFQSYTGDKLDSFTSTSTVVGAVKELINAQQCGIFNVSQLGSATIARIANWCDLPIKYVNTAEELRKREGVYLVNNVMSISKLIPFYKPLDIEAAIRVSYAELQKNMSNSNRRA